MKMIFYLRFIKGTEMLCDMETRIYGGGEDCLLGNIEILKNNWHVWFQQSQVMISSETIRGWKWCIWCAPDIVTYAWFGVLILTTKFCEVCLPLQKQTHCLNRLLTVVMLNVKIWINLLMRYPVCKQICIKIWSYVCIAYCSHNR